MRTAALFRVGTLGAALMLPLAGTAATTKVDPAQLAAPLCDAPFAFDKEAGVCALPADKALDTLKPDDCRNVPGLAVEADKCVLKAAEVQGPKCSADATNLVYDAQTKSCVLVVGSPSSAPGDYIGDCFRVVSVPAGTNLRAGRTYAVTQQEAIEGGDKKLSLLAAELSYWPTPWTWGCRPRGGALLSANASALATAGARREGWAYGALVMPYKYFPGTRTFVAGMPIGAYLGWRWGQIGSGMTLAAALTLGQVKADTVDPKLLDADGKPTVTGSADVAALSTAVGMVFDVTKSGQGKPFKAGLFVGQDRVNSAPTVSYAQDRKWWLAIQLGFDFTDF